jgi:uncharacterized protein (DUF885 family)
MSKLFVGALIVAASTITFATLIPRRAIESPGAFVQNQQRTKPGDSATQLKKLFAESDAAELERNPLTALLRGDLRHADQLGDLFSDAHSEADYRANKADLARLKTIDRESLDSSGQLAFDVFESKTDLAIRWNGPELRKLKDLRPIDHFNGIQTWYPAIASGQAITQFATVKDFEDNIKRHRQFAQQIDVAIKRFREGMSSGVVQPKLVVNRTIDQLDVLLQAPASKSVFAEPLKAFPKSIVAKDQKRVKISTIAAIEKDVLPAIRRLRDFLKNQYLPVARDGVGLQHMKGGLELYTYLIEATTSLPITAEEVHIQGIN